MAVAFEAAKKARKLQARKTGTRIFPPTLKAA
jgi:hypothetical protein